MSGKPNLTSDVAWNSRITVMLFEYTAVAIL